MPTVLIGPGTLRNQPGPFREILTAAGFRCIDPPGEHTLSLQLKGYKPLNKSIAVKKDTPLQIDESLEKQ